MEKLECIICGRKPEHYEEFEETDDGFVCIDCLSDLKQPQIDSMKDYEFDDI